MIDILFVAVLVETITERIKELGFKGYSSIISLILSLIFSFLLELSIVDTGNYLVDCLVSGIIVSGGSNYVNSLRDKLKK